MLLLSFRKILSGEIALQTELVFLQLLNKNLLQCSAAVPIPPPRAVSVFMVPSSHQLPPIVTHPILSPFQSRSGKSVAPRGNKRGLSSWRAPRGPFTPCVILPSLLIYVLLAFIRAPPPRRFKRVALKTLALHRHRRRRKRTVPRRVTSPPLTCRLITCIK